MHRFDGSRITFTVLGVFCASLFGAIDIANWQLGEAKSMTVHFLSICGIGGASLINICELLRRHQARASN